MHFCLTTYKQTYFNSLLSKYESYLKKLYYLCHGEEVPSSMGDAGHSTLANAIHGFKCLWNLKYAATEEGKRFSGYLDMVRQWRNDEAHRAPITTDEEVNAAIKVLVAMYLFVTGNSITDLEMQESAGTSTGKQISDSHAQVYEAFEEDNLGYSVAAEPGPGEE